MPIYEYECQACGDVQEIMQKVADPAPEACGACKQGPMVKLMSRTAFILKGSGWYVTDFRGSQGSGGNKGGGGGASGGAGGDSGSSSSEASKPASETPKTTSESAPAAGCGAHACGAGSCASS